MYSDAIFDAAGYHAPNFPSQSLLDKSRRRMSGDVIGQMDGDESDAL